MKTISRTLHMLAALGLAAGVLMSPAMATPIVSISPVNQTIGVGGTATIDIIVSGLTDPTGGFSLILNYNNAILSGLSFANDPDVKMGAAPLDLSAGFTGIGVLHLDLFFVADAGMTEADLAASEGSGFRLATVSFTGLADGLSPLSLADVVLSNWDGTATLDGVETRNGQVCVSSTGAPCSTVPEPGSILLVATALGALAIRRRRQAA
ncbi:MAG TPA: PEP-CTERM sorting domain-containing protein [Casimicrobiaceae bacterium]|nr:PEP-CTERM sorting domain-containing protein [Casimicrobiaceae bacterium]